MLFDLNWTPLAMQKVVNLRHNPTPRGHNEIATFLLPPTKLTSQSGTIHALTHRSNFI